VGKFATAEEEAYLRVVLLALWSAFVNLWVGGVATGFLCETLSYLFFKIKFEMVGVGTYGPRVGDLHMDPLLFIFYAMRCKRYVKSGLGFEKVQIQLDASPCVLVLPG
jgi:hypothetical protein